MCEQSGACILWQSPRLLSPWSARSRAGQDDDTVTGGWMGSPGRTVHSTWKPELPVKIPDVQEKQWVTHFQRAWSQGRLGF